MPVDAVVLLYRPELGRSLKELGFCYPAEGALWLQQVVYWLKKQMGYVMKNGQRYIYNSYADWTKDQITSLSPWEFGKMIRQFRQWGWITTACFAHLMDEFVNPEEVPEEFHPYKTSTWVSLNDKVIESAIGWNPFSEEINTPTGTESLKPAPGAEIANATTGCCNHKDAPLQTPTPSIYKKNKTQPNISLEAKERNYFSGENKIEEVSQDGRVGNTTEYKYSDTPTEKDKPSLPGKDKKSSSQDKFSAPLSAKFKNSEKPNNSRQTLPVKKVEVDRQLYEWEIAQGRPYDVFLRWWADRKYVPQGGRWEVDALGNAYSEFYNNPNKTTAVTFPQFMEFMAQVASNENQARFAGLKVILPSCFKVLPIPTHENVQQLMANIQVLIDDGADVAVRQEIATPSCQQSISYEEALDGTIKPLADLKSPKFPPTTETNIANACDDPVSAADSSSARTTDLLDETLEQSLSSILSRKQAAWRNLPHLRNSIIAWVEQTEGVVLGENGPSLEHAAVGQDADFDAPNGQDTEQTDLAPTKPTGSEMSDPTRPAEHAFAYDDPATLDAPDPTTDLLTPGQDNTARFAPDLTRPEADSAPSQTTVKSANAQSTADNSTPVAPGTSSNQEVEPTATRDQEAPVFKVGDRVVWRNAPPHWASWGALIIRAINKDKVLVDMSNIWILISELRQIS